MIFRPRTSGRFLAAGILAAVFCMIATSAFARTFSSRTVSARTIALPSASAVWFQESGKVEHQASNQPAKESREAAGEDENEQFKHSAAVKFIAKITRLSLDHAYWLSVLVNFAIIAGLLAWAMKKNLPGMFRSRTASIQKAMEEARKASEDARRRLAEVESRLMRLDVEIGELHRTAEKEVEAEESRIKVATVEEARKIVESAEQEITAATKAARRELTAYAANLAVSLAEKQIKVDSATDQGLVRGFSDQLSPKEGNGKDGR